MTQEQQERVKTLITLAEEAIKNGGSGSFNYEASFKQAELYMQLARLVTEI